MEKSGRKGRSAGLLCAATKERRATIRREAQREEDSRNREARALEALPRPQSLRLRRISFKLQGSQLFDIATYSISQHTANQGILMKIQGICYENHVNVF